MTPSQDASGKSRCIGIPLLKMYEHPGGHDGIRDKRGTTSKVMTKIQKFSLLPSTFRVGHKVGCHCVAFHCLKRLPNAPGKTRRNVTGKTPMAKWIFKRLLSVHAVAVAHDACCTLTSEYVTNSECWSPCSNVAGGMDGR